MVVVTVVLLTSLDVVTPSVVVAAELCLLPAAGLTSPADAVAAHLAAAGGRRLGRPGQPAARRVAAPVHRRSAWRCGWSGWRCPGCSWWPPPTRSGWPTRSPCTGGVPTRFAVGALAALRLVPLLVTEFESVRLARRTRGVEAGPQPGGPGAAGRRHRRSRCWSARSGGPAGWPPRWTPAASTPGCRAPTPADRSCTPGTPGSSPARSSVCAAAVTASVLGGAWDPVFVGG